MTGTEAMNRYLAAKGGRADLTGRCGDAVTTTIREGEALSVVCDQPSGHPLDGPTDRHAAVFADDGSILIWWGPEDPTDVAGERYEANIADCYDPTSDEVGCDCDFGQDD